jgi:uncharacterized protein (TIGR00369 family)
MTEEHYRRLERMYLAAPINEIFRPSISIEDGRAEISFDVDSRYHHTGGSAHGSVYFKAMDDAAFFAVNSVVDDVFVFTVSFNVYLLRPVVESRLTARGTVTSASQNLWIAESVVTDDRDRVVGRGSGSFMRSRMALGSVPAYATGG